MGDDILNIQFLSRLKNSDLLKNTKEQLIKNFLFIYTFSILLFKSIQFVGMMLDNLHASVSFAFACRIFLNKAGFYIGFILIFVSFGYLFKSRRKRAWYLFIINSFLSVLLLLDMWYYRGFSTMPTLHVLGQSSNLNGLGDSIFGMAHRVDLVFLFDLPVIFLLLIIFRKKLKITANRNVAVFLSCIAVAVVAIAFLPIKNLFRDEKDRTVVVYSYDSTVTCYGLSPIGYNIYSIYEFWKDSQTEKLSDDKIIEIKNWYDQKNENLPDNKYKGMLKGKNLIIMQIESLEKFVINQKINGQEITPYLNKILKNSFYFSEVNEQVVGGMSSDADLMTNTSMYPVRSGSTFFRYPDTTYNSLPKLMKSMGYTTTAIHPDPGSFWNWRVALSSMGFQKCIDASSFDAKESIGMGISDGSYLRQIVPIIKTMKAPFYTFLVTLTNHTPYNIPSIYRNLDLDKNLDKTELGGYLQSINYTDRHLGVFFETLKKEGILDNSVIVIYGDHEGIHKYFPDVVKNFKPSQEWWMDNHKKTPLIIYSPGITGEEFKVTGGEIDIMPTVSYLMGVDEKAYADTAMGRNLFKTNKDFAIVKGKYEGAQVSDADKQHALQGPVISDTIIRSNYFKKAGK